MNRRAENTPPPRMWLTNGRDVGIIAMDTRQAEADDPAAAHRRHHLARTAGGQRDVEDRRRSRVRGQGAERLVDEGREALCVDGAGNGDLDVVTRELRGVEVHDVGAGDAAGVDQRRPGSSAHRVIASGNAEGPARQRVRLVASMLQPGDRLEARIRRSPAQARAARNSSNASSTWRDSVFISPEKLSCRGGGNLDRLVVQRRWKAWIARTRASSSRPDSKCATPDLPTGSCAAPALSEVRTRRAGPGPRPPGFEAERQ